MSIRLYLLLLLILLLIVNSSNVNYDNNDNAISDLKSDLVIALKQYVANARSDNAKVEMLSEIFMAAFDINQNSKENSRKLQIAQQQPAQNLCRIGFFSSSGYEPCQACPIHSTNDKYGEKTCYCESSYFGANGNPPCYKCGNGYYSDKGKAFCTWCVGFSPCSDNFNVSAPGKQNPPLLVKMLYVLDD